MCEKKRGEGGISEGGFSNDACLWMWMAQVSVSIHASECESESVRFRGKLFQPRSTEVSPFHSRSLPTQTRHFLLTRG